VLDFAGEPMVKAGDGARTLVTTLSMARLREYRARFPAHLDADVFELQEPGGLQGQ